MRLVELLAYSLIVLVFSACKEDSSEPVSDEEVRIRSYVDSVGLDATLNKDGIFEYFISSNSNSQNNKKGDIYSIQYELYDLDGELLHQINGSTEDTVVILKQGAGAVYPVGIDYALGRMKPGEVMGFIIPSSLAYGDLTLAGIQDQAVLHIIIHLIGVRGQNDLQEYEEEVIDQYVKEKLSAGSSKIHILPQAWNTRKKTSKEGDKGQKVSSGDTVSVSYSMKTLDGRYIDAVGPSDPFVFIVDNKPSVMLGMNEGIKGMNLKERATFVMPSKAAYDCSVAVIPPFLVDPSVVSNELNPLLLENILPTYVTRVSPFEVILVEMEVVSVR